MEMRSDPKQNQNNHFTLAKLQSFNSQKTYTSKYKNYISQNQTTPFKKPLPSQINTQNNAA